MKESPLEKIKQLQKYVKSLRNVLVWNITNSVPGVLLNFLFNLYFQSNFNEKQKNSSRHLFDDSVKHSSGWVFWIVF